MENILRYYLMPHPPLIIPEVGRGQEKVIQKTIDACYKIGEEIGCNYNSSWNNVFGCPCHI